MPTRGDKLWRWSGRLLEYFYPSLCSLCLTRLSGTDELGVCPLCSLELKHYEPNVYTGQERLYASPLFGSLYALYAYEKHGAVQRLIHAIKYRGYAETARYIGRTALCRYAEEWRDCYDIVLAVPIEPRRLELRGFNQALLVAKVIAQGLGVAVADDLIYRRRGSHRQTHLRRMERIDNMKDAFRLTPRAEALLRGRRVLLVDDVLTTGSTLTELCLLLERAEVARVDVFVAAVAI